MGWGGETKASSRFGIESREGVATELVAVVEGGRERGQLDTRGEVVNDRVAVCVVVGLRRDGAVGGGPGGGVESGSVLVVAAAAEFLVCGSCE